MHAGREGECSSELLGVAGNSRGRGERTRGEQNTGLVEEGVMRREDCFGVMEFSI